MAAGLALTGGTVRVLDATGKALTIASNKVAASTGAYGPITLGTAMPYRIEACGTVGDKPVCLWGATNQGGTLNLTPLTSAITMLASGQSPETLMTGAAQGLADTDIAAAHTQLRTALASALTDAGLASNFDLLTGALTPGSHTGYDRLLDTVSVSLGLDSKAYIALNSSLGSGTAYLEPGTSLGSLSLNAAAATVDFPGIDSLYKALGAAMPVANTCNTALPALLDANVRASLDLITTFAGPQSATTPLCLHMSGSLTGDVESLLASTLMPAAPSRCDFSGADPVCRVSLVFKTKAGVLRPVGVEQAVVKRPGGWLFLGNRLEVQASAVARLVLTRRVDQTAADVSSRNLDVRIPTYPGLQCARVSQKDTSGADVALALFKPVANATYLSLWATSASNATPSLDPATGATQGANAISLAVPGSTAGDTTVRNFIRAGRALKVELFADGGCSTPLAGADGGVVSIDVAGQLPLNLVGLSGQPWPVLAPKSGTELVALKSTNGAITYSPTWTLQALAVNKVQLCADAACNAKLSELDLAGNALTAKLTATVGTQALNANAYRLLRLTGRTSSGLVLQLDTASCAAQPANQAC